MKNGLAPQSIFTERELNKFGRSLKRDLVDAEMIAEAEEENNNNGPD